MIDQRRAGRRAEAGDDIEHARRKACGQRELAEPQRGQWRDLGGLEHHGAAAGQRRGDLPHGDHERKIPRHDHADHAEWLTHGVGQRVEPRRNDLAVDFVGPTGVVGQRVENRREILPPDRRDRLARIKTLELDELFGVLADALGKTQQQLPPVAGAKLTPGAIESGSCRAYRGIDIGSIARRDARNRPLGRGIERVEVLARRGGHAAAVDQQIAGLDSSREGAGGRFINSGTKVHIWSLAEDGQE